MLGSQIALGILVVLVLVRLPSAVREPSSRLTWLASITGCAAFTTVGIVIPLEVVDGWLGGTNVVNLVQNLLAVTAFWFLMQASRTLDGSRFDRGTIWELPAMLVAFTIPFFLMESRGPTSENFIKEQANEVGLWAYASIYMLCVAFVMIRMLAGVRGRRPKQYGLIRVGGGAIALASLVEVLYLTLRLFQAEPRSVVELIGRGFTLPFYGGVVVAALGIGWFALARATRVVTMNVLRLLLTRANARHGLQLEILPTDRDAMHDTYRLAVRLADVANNEKLAAWEGTLLRTATRILDRQLRAPAVVRMSQEPVGIA